MIDDELSDQDLENREVLAAKIREHQAKAAEGVVEVDKTYADVLQWWREAKPHFVEMAAGRDVEFTRADAISIAMYAIASGHTPTDITLMLASKVVDEEAAK
jgi:hypothetical protein